MAKNSNERYARTYKAQVGEGGNEGIHLRSGGSGLCGERGAFLVEGILQQFLARKSIKTEDSM